MITTDSSTNVSLLGRIKHRDNLEVATEFGMGVASLYAAKHQIAKMITDSMQRLETPGSYFDS